jgi:predicted GNAT family acetyltransferase
MPEQNEAAPTARDNQEESRYEVTLDGETAFLTYERRKHSIVLVHTEVPTSLGGRGLGGILARHALDDARAEGNRVVVQCPFVQSWLRRHPEYSDVVIWPRP